MPDSEQFQEKIHLSFSSVSVDDPKKPQAVIIRLKRSKTDPFQSGVSVYFARILKDLCPVEAFLAYLQLRGTVHSWQDHCPSWRVALLCGSQNLFQWLLKVWQIKGILGIVSDWGSYVSSNAENF